MHRLGLPYVNAELTMPNEELATIEPCSDTLGTLHRIGEEGVMIVVASNLALPYSTPLRALWGILMPPSSLGAIRPDRAFYAGLKALLGCDAMIFTAPWRLDHAQRVDRRGRASHPRQFMAVR